MSGPALNQEVMAVFREEAESLINEMTKDMDFLIVDQENEKGEQDLNSIYERLYRNAHTLKGSAGVVGYGRLNEISKVMENLFSRALEGTFLPSKTELEILMDSAVACNQLFQKDTVSDYPELVNRLKKMI